MPAHFVPNMILQPSCGVLEGKCLARHLNFYIPTPWLLLKLPIINHDCLLDKKKSFSGLNRVLSIKVSSCNRLKRNNVRGYLLSTRTHRKSSSRQCWRDKFPEVISFFCIDFVSINCRIYSRYVGLEQELFSGPRRGLASGLTRWPILSTITLSIRTILATSFSRDFMGWNWTLHFRQQIGRRKRRWNERWDRSERTSFSQLFIYSAVKRASVSWPTICVLLTSPDSYISSNQLNFVPKTKCVWMYCCASEERGGVPGERSKYLSSVPAWDG